MATLFDSHWISLISCLHVEEVLIFPIEMPLISILIAFENSEGPV